MTATQWAAPYVDGVMLATHEELLLALAGELFPRWRGVPRTLALTWGCGSVTLGLQGVEGGGC